VGKPVGVSTSVPGSAQLEAHMMIYWGHEAQEKIDGYKALEA
jgi:hypothetical protein